LSDLKCESRDLDATQCYDKLVQGFTDTTTINNLCENFYGEEKSGKCKLKENFCEMCCTHFVGVNFMDKRFACMDKCKGMISNTSFGALRKN